HLVTSDVWTSMGFESENEERRKAFADWCVDSEMMAAAAPDAIYMHCLPAHRGEEVTAEVIDGPQSVVWDEAENRLHVQKALMDYLVPGRMGGPSPASSFDQVFGRPLPPAWPTIERNSRRVEASSRNAPSIRLVTMETPGLCTPRVLMHWWA